MNWRMAPWRRTLISTASPTRVNGPMPASAKSSPRPGLKLAEWPEHAAAVLPLADLRLYIDSHDDDSRSVRLEAGTARGLALL